MGIIIIAGIPLIVFISFLLVPVTMSDKALEAVSASSHQFGHKLYKLLREQPGNVFFSPISLQVVLSLARMGAKGKTAEEILTALALPKDVELVKKGYHSVMTSLKSTDDMILEIANKVYSEKTFAVEKDFGLVAEKFFLAAAENLDFKTSSDQCRKTMNSWVEQKTHDKIKDLLAPGDITSDTRMVLINAVYFKGKWRHPFNPEKTSKEPFHISSTETTEVDMMHTKSKFGYMELEDLDAKMLVMPYTGDKMFMVILLPNEIDGLAQMEQKLQSVNVADLIKNADRPEVHVSLPRFKIEKTIDLKDLLQKMGIESMFDGEKADFSGISKERGLYVSKVVQKAYIEVNEEGSEAAAATDLQFMFRSKSPCPSFLADKPFLFFLMHNSALVFRGLYKGESRTFAELCHPRCYMLITLLSSTWLQILTWSNLSLCLWAKL